MGRRLGVAVIGALMVLSTLAVAEPAGAAKFPVSARGDVACTMTGRVKFTPKLTAAPAGVTAKVTGKLVCSTGEAGNPAVTVLKGRLKGTSPSFTGSCTARNPQTIEASITWKAPGGRVAPSTIAFAPVADQSAPTAVYQGGDITGSYANETPELQLALEKQCGNKGLRSSKVSGSFSIDGSCDADTPTEHGVTLGASGHVWFVVVPQCPFTDATHPTGTISWSFPPAPPSSPGCGSATDVPLASSGQVGASTPRGLVTSGAPFWGVDIGTLPGDACSSAYSVSYSGDSSYQPFTFSVTP